MEIFVDADACPVKDEVLKVAERHNLKVHIVSNQWMRMPRTPMINVVVVPENPDAADDWIAEHIGCEDIAITGDIPLADRCIKQQAMVLNHNGKAFTEESIGMALAMRDLMTHLRETGEMTSGAAAFSKRDRSRFLEMLERAVQEIKRR
ncbi:MAG: YaiI/YqxD family protein [Rhodospirillales bacterium]|nr:YaiI/YqxD family protein [Rhodospirillales bacterium]